MKILFISHEASRTGAPFYLLHICRYLKEHTSWQLYFLLKQDGPLHREFAELGTTLIYNDRSSPQNALGKLKYRLEASGLATKFRQQKLLSKLKQLNLDLIYSNTATNGVLLQEISDLHVRVITHVHELGWAMNLFGKENLDLIKKYTTHYISSSPSVTAFIQKEFNPEQPIGELSCFPIHNVPSQVDPSAVKASLGIPAYAFVVGASGTVEWRKGWDLFVRLAWEARQLDTEASVCFVWIGGMSENNAKDVQLEIKLQGLENKVFFTGHKSNPMDFYAALDVFCLMSREEAFGIVAIENALYGTPVLCFDTAAGLANFIKEDAGIVVPYPDTRKMAESVLYLAQHRQVRDKFGQVARKRVMEEYSIECQGNLLINHLQALL